MWTHGPMYISCGPFRYFMVLIDASIKWSHGCLLSTHNVAFARLLAQIIRLRAHIPDQPIKIIRLDNAVNLHPEHLIIIACPLALILNTLLHTLIPKMAS